MKPAISKLICMLLFLIMCSMLVVCPTLARYVTNTDLTNDARVSKWGVTVSYSGNSMSSRYYGTTEAGVESATNVNRFGAGSTAAGITVKGSTDVIAPGTWGYINYPVITGKPEVAIKVTQEFDLTLTNWKDENGVEYCPLIFKVDYGADMKIGGKKAADKYYFVGGDDRSGNKINSVSDLQSALKDAITSASTTYEPNTDLEADNKYRRAVLRVYWCWPFDKTGNVWGASALNDFAEKVEDPGYVISDPVKDTYLCDLSADSKSSNNVKIAYDVSCKVEQID